MYIRVPVEIILASFLFLSRVTSRHSDVICGRGLGEGDKWFDGCQWCLCQRSGPLCSPAPCADLVTRIPPCETIGSRWWDGCYHCTCRYDGIECIADQTCVMLMRSKPYMREILGLSPCVMLKDNRCICGVDGIPSCSAEVIDRKSFRATTIGLDASFPSSTRLLTPRATHFNAAASRTDNSRSASEQEQRHHHHHRGVRLQEGSLRNVRAENSRSGRYLGYSRRKRRSSQPSWLSFPTLDYVRARTRSSHERVSSHHSRKHDIRASSPSQRGRDEWNREFDFQRDQKHEHRNAYTGTNSAHLDSQERTRELGKWDSSWERQERQSSRHRRGYRRKSEHREWVGDMAEREVPVSTAGFLQDDPRDVHIPSSVLVASDNRCRYGVRWYGGGLRCYCDVDGSITCGEPNFVASRIDGFRLKMSDCEEGHVWEDEDSCRVCECRQSGLMECRRSPSCPLPYLVQPLAAEWQEDGLDDLGGRKLPQKRIGEFRGQEEDEIDWSKVYSRLRGFDEEGRYTGKNNLYGDENDDEDEDDDDSLREQMLTSSELDGSGELLRSGDEEQTDLDEDIPDQRVYPEKPDKDPNRGSGNEDFVVLNVDPWKKELILDSGSENVDTFTDTARDDKTRRKNVHYKQDKPRATVDDQINLSRRNENGYDNIKNPKITYGNEIDFSKDRNSHRSGKGKNSNEFESNTSKGTTVVIVRECRPHSRWMTGCLRCHCSSKGRKICDDSRCLKAELATVKTSKDSVFDEGKRYPRPMQRPPVLAMSRNTPIRSRFPGKLISPCGRFKVSQVYWEDCNLCYCTPHGPKCTAKNCG